MTRKRFIKLMMSKGFSRNDVQKYAELISKYNQSYENQFIRLTEIAVGGWVPLPTDTPFPRSLVGMIIRTVIESAYEVELNPGKKLCIDSLAIKAIPSQRSISQRSMSAFG